MQVFKDNLLSLYYLLGNNIAEESSEILLIVRLVSQFYSTRHGFCSTLCQ